MKKIWEILLETAKKNHKIIFLFLFRIVCLLAAVRVGWWLGTVANVNFFCNTLMIDKKVAEYLATATVGIPVFFVLWCFRTRDKRQEIDIARQQIEKVQGQLDQNKYNISYENLTSKTRTKVEVGALSLIKLSEITPEFDELIKIAFIERLKYYPFVAGIKDIKITYGRHILNWLFDKTNEKIIPQEADLSNQDLSRMDLKNATGVFVKFEDAYLIETKLQNVKLMEANFKNASLLSANFKNAELLSADFQNANLSCANFIESDLRSAVFKKANLSNVDFQDADLENADFQDANLKHANFKNARITNANFTGANIEEAIFTDEQRAYIINNCIRE